MRSKKPNILVIIPHDLGDHLHCYGHSCVSSPNIDRLAENGVRFTNYFAAAPECTSSRASMLTGLHSHQNGLIGLTGMGWELNDYQLHLANRLRNNDYDTHLFGLQHESMDPELLGYEHLHAQDDKRAENVCERVVEFFDKPKTDKPWFAHVGFTHVHRVWPEHTTFNPDEIQVPPYLPDTPGIRRDLTLFYQNILEMDMAVGKVFEALERQGLAEDTLVIFTTDHGAPYPRAKATYFDPGIHIPLIMSQPGRVESGVAVDSLLSNLDFTPTIFEYAGIPLPDKLEGRSFASLIDSSNDYCERDIIFGGMCYDVSYDPIYYARTRELKYIRSFAVDKREAKGADSRVLATFAAGEWIRFDDYDVMSSPAWQDIADTVDRSIPPSEALYDLINDPNELNNLIDNPEYIDRAQEMRSALYEMLKKTKAPLVNGHIPPTEKQITAACDYGRKLGIR